MNDVFTWPVGRGEHPPNRAPITPVAVYLAAATVAGGLAGLSLGAVGAVVRTLGGDLGVSVLLVAGSVVVLFALPMQWAGDPSLLPQRREQVPRTWLLWRHRSATALGFGLLIGAGALTPIRFASAYALAAIVILSPSLWMAGAVGALYGFVRGLALALTWIGDTIVGTRLAWEQLARDRRLDAVLALAIPVCFVPVVVLVAERLSS